MRPNLCQMATTEGRCSILPVAIHHLLQEFRHLKKSSTVIPTNGATGDNGRATARIKLFLFELANRPLNRRCTLLGTSTTQWLHPVKRLTTVCPGVVACKCCNQPTAATAHIFAKNETENNAGIRRTATIQITA